MQTLLSESVRRTPAGVEADRILRSCVHCGFCNATCPTYQLLGDELDGPRGRIYQIKQMLEDAVATRATLLHLDRCLTCRNCETTCPSGVRYGDLLHIGRELAESRIGRPWNQRIMRWMVRGVVSHRTVFATVVRMGRLLRPLLPGAWRRKLPVARTAGSWPVARHSRRMIVLGGCVQPTLAPEINASAARVLDRLGISLVVATGAGCCGAASQHTSGFHAAKRLARQNVDAWWPMIEAGVEAIVMTSSGCGVHVKEYVRLLGDDPAYSERARRISELTRDLGEILAREDLSELGSARFGEKVAFQAPCTLQHGQRLGGVVEDVLRRLGFDLVPYAEAHLCCGSAGTYSLLQPELSQRLLKRKLSNLAAASPSIIATANIGCLAHLAGESRAPVRHWIELIDTAC